MKSQVVDFYYQTDVICTAPRLDEITVWTEKGEEKMRKYYLMMYLHEVYAMFKTVYPDCEIGFTMFTVLRPNNILLLKNQPMDQGKCSLHENFHLKLEACRISFDAIFRSKILCCSKNYNSEWKCMNGKNIPFPRRVEPE